MSTFLNFLSAAADFALTLNLKVAIVAAGFIVLLVLTRTQGKGPEIGKTPGPPTSVVAPQEVGLLQGSDATD
jgi:hypothetical protein